MDTGEILKGELHAVTENNWKSLQEKRDNNNNNNRPRPARGEEGGNR